MLYGKSLSLLLRATVAGENQFLNWYTYIALLLFLASASFWMMRFNKVSFSNDVSLFTPPHRPNCCALETQTPPPARRHPY